MSHFLPTQHTALAEGRSPVLPTPGLRRLLPLAVSLAMTACQDKNTMMEPEPDDDAPQYLISTPGEQVAFDRKHVPGSRKAEEDAAMAELLSLLPNDRDRAKMEELMNAPGVFALSVKEPEKPDSSGRFTRFAEPTYKRAHMPGRWSWRVRCRRRSW